MVLLTCLLFVVIGGFTMMLMQAYREYDNFKGREQAMEERVTDMRRQVSAKERYLDHLLNNPEFLERVIRLKLGYARPDEVIFRFDERPER